MKKSPVSQKKTERSPRRDSQKKITSFFTNNCKLKSPEKNLKKQTSLDYNLLTEKPLKNVFNNSTSTKRKRSETSELLESTKVRKQGLNVLQEIPCDISSNKDCETQMHCISKKDVKVNVNLSHNLQANTKHNENKNAVILLQKHDDTLNSTYLEYELKKESVSSIKPKDIHIDINEHDINSINEFDEFFQSDWNSITQLDLSVFHRCNVTNIKKEERATILSIQHVELKTSDSVTCLEFWKDIQVKKGDAIIVQAKKEAQGWIVNNCHGFIVIQPDILISSTIIAGSFFCTRRAVLANKFGKIESFPRFMSDQSALSVGKLMHNILQDSLSTNTRKLSDIMEIAKKELQSKETINMLYKCQIPFNKCKQEVFLYVPKIFEFIQHYIAGNEQRAIANLKDNFKGKISAIHDIEENIWLPKLGIKGKVDVAAEVKIHSRRKKVPIEVKTGRTTFSLEHKAQVILYIMMMSQIDQKVDSGLLLYLKENQMQEVTCGHVEKRDLILLRNNLVDYFTRSMYTDITSEAKNIWDPMPLPEPIDHPSACQRCPYKNLCCAHLIKDVNIQLYDKHPLTILTEQMLETVGITHINYVIKWISLLQMEESMQFKEFSMKDIWTLSPEKRELKGTCLCNLKVIGKVIQQDRKYLHTFVRVNEQPMCSEFVENQHVIVSTDNRIAVAVGVMISVNKDFISIRLDRDITKKNGSEGFHIDKYVSSTLLLYPFANIGMLLNDSDICKKLRSIIIDRIPATFITRPPSSLLSTTEPLMHFNDDQKRAIYKALTANDYVLIKGMPGTGKTETIATLVELLNKLGSSVIVTSHTHSAVDNILLKLIKKNIDFIRFGSLSMIHPLLKHKTEDYLTTSCNTVEELESVYANKNIVGVTCIGAHNEFFARKIFDICIVDESTQIFQPVVLAPLYSARKFILVGDPDQLPPVVQNKTAKKLGAEETLFERLDSENNTVVLSFQYRMNASIMRVANELTYNGKLKAGNELVQNATFSSSEVDTLSTDTLYPQKWLKMVLSPKLDDSVVVLDTGCTQNMKINFVYEKEATTSRTYSNIWEAALILYLSQIFVQLGVKPENVGVMAPYKAQVTLLRKLLITEVEVNTIDQYQGRDKSVILYSCAKSDNKRSDKQEYEILEDHRRLTVAITRAKHKLILIGDKETLLQYTPFKKFFGIVHENNIVNLCDNSVDFSWNEVTKSLNESFNI